MSLASVGATGAGEGRVTRGSNSSVGVGRLQDRLLFVPGALTENAVEAKPDEYGHQREDDDYGQS